MPREIKTTIAVDGEQAFKRAINEANTSMKNLGTQLTLAQAQFRKDGDAMKLMETRSKALKGEIGQQEEIVRALEKAVTDSSKAYGENSEKTEKWEAELNRAKAKLINLQSELTLNEQGLDRNGKAFDDSTSKAADYQATLQTIGKNVSFENVTSGIGKITDTVSGAIKKVLSFAKTIRDTFADAGEWADQLMTDATKYGMDVETLQRWRNAADFIDTDVETIITARDKMSKKIKGGWKDGKLDMWQVLGVDLKDADGKARDKMDIMWDLGETLLHISEMQERGTTNYDAEALSMEVFGKSWRDLLPLFKAGRQEWEAALADADVVSEERVKTLGELDDANKALENAWDATKYSFLADLSPTITDVTNAVTEMIRAFGAWMDTDEGRQAMEDLSKAIQELFAGLKDVKFKDAIDTVSTAINGIKDGLIWLNTNKGTVVTTLEIIAGGFALLKVTELAINIGKIAEGFKTIFSFSGKKPPTLPTTTGDNTGTGGNNGTENVGTENVTTENVTTQNVTTQNATTQNLTTANITSGNTTTENVQTMYVQNMIGGNGGNPTTPGTNPSLPSGGPSGYVPFLYPSGGGDTTFNLGSGDNTFNLSGGDNTLNLPAGDSGGNAIELGPDDYHIDGPGTEEPGINGNDNNGPRIPFDPYALIPAAVVAVATLPAMVQQWVNETGWKESLESAEEAANALEEALGESSQDAEILRQAAQAVGPNRKANGEYDTDVTGMFLNMNPTSQREYVLQMLSDPKMRGILYSDFMRYGDPENDNVAGWRPWSMMMRYWGLPVEDAFGNQVTEPLSQGEIDELVTYIRDIYQQKVQEQLDNRSGMDTGTLMNDAVAEMKTNTDSTKAAADVVSGMDLKKFNGLPAELQLAAMKGTADGVSGIRVYLDGATVGRLVAPYVNQALGQQAV